METTSQPQSSGLDVSDQDSLEGTDSLVTMHKAQEDLGASGSASTSSSIECPSQDSGEGEFTSEDRCRSVYTSETERDSSKSPRRALSLDATNRIRFVGGRENGFPLEPSPRPNKASLKRTEYISKSNKEEEYLTPSQRKDKRVRDMAERMRILEAILREKNLQIRQLQEEMRGDLDKVVSEKEEDIEVLRSQMRALQTSYDELLQTHDKSMKDLDAAEQTVHDLKDEMERREEDKRTMLLEMFQKGQKCAEFERQEDLERALRVNPGSVAVRELLLKLQTTESRLEHWQTVRRQESYQDSQMPTQEAEVMLRFLRDSMLHYLTDKRDAAQHLSAIIGILGFTEVQKKKIKKAMAERKNSQK